MLKFCVIFVIFVALINAQMYPTDPLPPIDESLSFCYNYVDECDQEACLQACIDCEEGCLIEESFPAVYVCESSNIRRDRYDVCGTDVGSLPPPHNNDLEICEMYANSCEYESCLNVCTNCESCVVLEGFPLVFYCHETGVEEVAQASCGDNYSTFPVDVEPPMPFPDQFCFNYIDECEQQACLQACTDCEGGCLVEEMFPPQFICPTNGISADRYSVCPDDEYVTFNEESAEATIFIFVIIIVVAVIVAVIAAVCCVTCLCCGVITCTSCGICCALSSSANRNVSQPKVELADVYTFNTKDNTLV
jgi:hypothetical protein